MYKLCNVGFLTNLIVLYFAEKDFILHVKRERQHAISILEEAPWKLYSNVYHVEYGSKSSQDSWAHMVFNWFWRRKSFSFKPLQKTKKKTLLLPRLSQRAVHRKFPNKKNELLQKNFHCSCGFPKTLLPRKISTKTSCSTELSHRNFLDQKEDLRGVFILNFYLILGPTCQIKIFNFFF